MRIVFLNSMERRLQERAGHADLAQVWIGEEGGVWRIGWDEEGSAGTKGQIWFEGESWSEMLSHYRYQLAVKLADGFRPVISGIFHEEEGSRGMSTQKLYCYSEFNGNEELYAGLSAWRRQKAAAAGKAPYLIASNRLLRLISAFVPKSLEELTQLPGVGEVKAAEYGEEMLAITAQVERDWHFPLDWVEQELDEELFRSWTYKQKETRFKAEIERSSLRRQLLAAIREGRNLEQIQEAAGLSRREAIEQLEQLEKEGYDTEALVEQELTGLAQEEQTAIWNAYLELGDVLLKPVMQKVYGADTVQSGNGELERRYEWLRLIRLRYRRAAKGEAAGKPQSA
ncbi:helicase [Paenibacillus yonginensis]|uniref:Helicase n=1 Tax=Paenibacillus yonginensis TaxID=1462996 RepID=A0A1B1MWU7_9BACL|nr:HRDC domain-containing protein [Paenibacillus yonginensis]ANS73646.1 helicase [Paenibacillus yonginensis]